MVTRDITGQYQQIWIAVHNTRVHTKHSSKTGLYNPLLDENDVEEEIPWRDTFDKIKEIIKDIQTRMRQLKEMHKQCLRPKMNQQSDKYAVEIATTQLKACFKNAEGMVRKLVTEYMEDSEHSQQHNIVITNMKTALVTSLSELSHRFHQDQRGYLYQLEKQKSRARQYAELGGQYVEELDESQLKSRQLVDEYVSRGFTADQIQALVETEMSVAERDKDLRGLYSDIVDLHEIFKDMAALVLEQGSMLDRIDYNIENTKASIQEANKQLAKGTELQRKMGYKLCIMMLLFAVIGFGFAFVIKISKRRRN